MNPNELTKLPFTADFLPEDWSVIPDDENDKIFIALPNWFLAKLKAGRVNEKDFQDYRHQCLDLQIEFNLV